MWPECVKDVDCVQVWKVRMCGRCKRFYGVEGVMVWRVSYSSNSETTKGFMQTQRDARLDRARAQSLCSYPL